VTRLILIRHGETDWNIEGRWQGQADVPLNERGREQALRIAQALSREKIAAVYSSDLCRARETAQVLAACLGQSVRLDRRLREIHQGEWQGLLVSEIEEKYAVEFQQRQTNPMSVAPPGGETARQVMERVRQAIEEIVRRHPEESVAVVSHGFAIACLLAHERNIPFQRIWELVPENGTWQEVTVKGKSL
jgi:alpha-ribazole phosphatase